MEILKALYRDARILILDEPTAVLTPQEASRLFSTLKSITTRGLAVIFISHKLHEILEISTRVAVLRRGAIVGQLDTADANREQLAQMMVGRTVSRPKLSPIEPGTPVLQIENLTSEGMGATALKQLNLTVYAHQIVGIAGVAGNGQGTLADILSGLNSSFTGSLLINDAAYCTGDPRAIVASGVGRIPEDRHARGHGGGYGNLGKPDV